MSRNGGCRYKVLDVPLWVNNRLWEGNLLKHRKEAPVRIKRDGWYFDRFEKVSWIEYDNGTKAIFSDISEFNCELKLCSFIPMSAKEEEALKLLVQNRPKDLVNSRLHGKLTSYFDDYVFHLSLYHIRKDSVLRGMGVKKRLHEFIRNLQNA